MSNSKVVDMCEFPRAIIHVDGDAFFVGCELASKPWLRGMPVVSGAERGIASALSYEAKALGVRRGMNMWEIRRVCPNVVVIPSDYDTYSMYSNRMVEIVKRYSARVEHYSIDECFADITGMDVALGVTYEEIARKIKKDLDTELGMTFSIGLSVDKVLAKSASSFKKPSGFTVVPTSKILNHLSNISIGKIWGIGRAMSVSLTGQKIFTALELAQKSDEWMRQNATKPIQEIHKELNGKLVYKINSTERESQKSIMCTRTFRPHSADSVYVFAELSSNIEKACTRLRRLCLCSRDISFYIKTKDFRYIGGEIKLPRDTCYPHDIINSIKAEFDKVFDSNTIYRTTGVRLGGLKPITAQTLNLFEPNIENQKEMIYKTIDGVVNKFGEHSIFFGSSMISVMRASASTKRIGMPSLGEVH
jgi:DNA polymerase IV